MAADAEKLATVTTTTDNAKASAEGNPKNNVGPMDLEQNPGAAVNSSAVEVKKNGNDSKTAVTITAVSPVSGDADLVTDTQKKIRRAERFGMPVQMSEEEKRNTRAESSCLNYSTTKCNVEASSSHSSPFIFEAYTPINNRPYQVIAVDHQMLRKSIPRSYFLRAILLGFSVLSSLRDAKQWNLTIVLLLPLPSYHPNPRTNYLAFSLFLAMFGTGSKTQGSEVSKTSEELKRKARAERFGLPVPSSVSEEEAKRKARLARFAPYPKTDSVEEDKRKARALRFSKTSSSSVSQVNGKGNIEVEAKAAITGEADGVA
ncbi:hypothetical protein WN943_003827 [Citrus x changshan-huyou]